MQTLIDRVISDSKTREALLALDERNRQAHEAGRDLEERHARRHHALMIRRGR